MPPEISIRPVESKSDLNAFVKLPWKIYKNDECWVPPMIFDVKRRLTEKHNHFFDHGRAKLFLAWKGSEPVGRISAQIDDNYDKHWGGKTGLFGWFESVDDPDVSNALFDAAKEWLKENGRDTMQGPYDFNINDECGLLVKGFDTPPMAMMKHNLIYYENLFDGYGFKKAQDLYAYRLDATADPPEDIANFAKLVRANDDIVIRNWDPKNIKVEMKKWLEVYNSAWEKNWGSVLLTEAEFMAHTLELKYAVDPEFVFIAENKKGEVMGMALALPNVNEYYAKVNGHIYNFFPTLWYQMFVKKKYKSLRVFTLGVKEEFRKSGIGAVFYYDTLMAAKKKGYTWGEMSWILESNDAMNRAIVNMGGEIYKTYRIYDKSI
jgi:GNAT superfamily N-acetyltransferase